MAMLRNCRKLRHWFFYQQMYPPVLSCLCYQTAKKLNDCFLDGKNMLTQVLPALVKCVKDMPGMFVTLSFRSSSPSTTKLTALKLHSSWQLIFTFFELKDCQATLMVTTLMRATVQDGRGLTTMGSYVTPIQITLTFDFELLNHFEKSWPWESDWSFEGSHHKIICKHSVLICQLKLIW